MSFCNLEKIESGTFRAMHNLTHLWVNITLFIVCFIFELEGFYSYSKESIRGSAHPYVQVQCHPRRPRGGKSGREKRRDKSFQAQAEKPLGTDSHRTISKRSSDCWLLIGHKNALYYCAQSANSISWVLFVSSYTTAIDPITACLAHAAKKCTQSGIFQFDINATFQNTGSLYTRA